MAGMYDAPLISPENKDSNSEIYASLPKIELAAAVEPAQDIAKAFTETLDALESENVIYAEIRLNPADFAEALGDGTVVDLLANAKTAIDDHKVDARIILETTTDADNVSELAEFAIHSDDIAGYALIGNDIPAHHETLRKLNENFVPVVVEGDFQAIEAGVKAGATRINAGIDIIDDFSATVEGIQPGVVTGWIRDRHITVELQPDDDVANGDADTLADHPLPLLQQLGFTCAVGAASLTDQFTSLNENMGYGLEEFFELTVAAIQNSFSDQEHRQHIIETIILPAYEEFSSTEFAEDVAAREAAEADHDDEDDTE